MLTLQAYLNDYRHLPITISCYDVPLPVSSWQLVRLLLGSCFTLVSVRTILYQKAPAVLSKWIALGEDFLFSKFVL